MSVTFKYKLIVFILTPLILTGCKTPNVTERYDEFKNIKICKLDPFLLISEGFNSPRVTSISLEKKDNSVIEGKIINHIVISRFFDSYTPIPENATIKFILTNNQRITEELTFKAHLQVTTSGFDTAYGAYGMTFSVPILDSSVIFDLTKTQLEKIISSHKVDFFFETKDAPIKGELKAKHKEELIYFMQKCCHS